MKIILIDYITFQLIISRMLELVKVIGANFINYYKCLIN